MGKKPGGKSAKAKTTKVPAARKGATKPDARLSALDAAAQVLAKSGKPMRAGELIAELEAKGLWRSPGGKTPAATLYSSMIREIAVKGTSSRFKKTERGLFVA